VAFRFFGSREQSRSPAAHPPRVSAGIADLGALLGVPLLERIRRRVVPAALGRGSAVCARAVLQGAEYIVATARAATDAFSGRFA
jgi:LysR family hydrogen peroxide-inducible transcriptional activator